MTVLHVVMSTVLLVHFQSLGRAETVTLESAILSISLYDCFHVCEWQRVPDTTFGLILFRGNVGRRYDVR